MPEQGLWHLRITYGDVSLNELVEFIKHKSDCICICHENDEDKRPHIHCCIVGFHQTKSTFCQQLKKKFSIKGNEFFSCRQKDDKEAQLKYMCKGHKDIYPMILHQHPDLDVSKYYNAYWETNKALIASKSEKQNSNQDEKKKRAPVKSWLERTYDQITLENPHDVVVIETFQLIYKPTDDEKSEHKKSRMVLFRAYMRCMGRAVKKVSLRIHEENFNGIINSICQNSYTEAGEKYSDRMYNTIYQN